MIISKRKVVAKKRWWCINCYRRIIPSETYWRLFGMAESGDKPGVIQVCTVCGEAQGWSK